jgi:hypothetical protein
VNFRLSERSTFRLDFDEIDVSYSQGATSSWTGYRQRTARATINRRVSDRSQVSAGLVASDYEADVNFNETRTVGLQASIRRNVSELWTIGLRTGVGRSDFSFQDQVTLETVDNADANYTLTVNATHRGERQTLDLSVARRLTPSSTGFFTERNELEMYLDRELAPRVSLRIGAIANESKSVGAQAPPNLRDYARFELGFNWRVRPRWSLITGYNYTSQDFPEEGTGRRTYDVLYCGIRYSGLSRPGAPR